ncbi:MFS transporter [Kribbella sp. NPDC023855]|uniref:MFS transporter n=1 Tax=Kribbella sp. NPDC023855 TaxID=3154698 RepID=UPI0034113C7C
MTQTVDEGVANPAKTYRLLATLQASQYVPINFIHLALVAILRDRGASLSQLAALNAAALLLAVKFLWAPLLDRYGARRGHFRSWLLVLQPVMALGLAALLPIDPVDDFGLLLLIVLLVVQTAAMQDVAGDALAVRTLRHGDRGFGSGMRLAGGYFGHVVGGGLSLLVYSRWGWQAAVLVVALITLVPLWQLASYHEEERGPRAQHQSISTLLAVFREPAVRRWTFVLLPLSWIGATSGYSLVTPMLVDADWSPDRIAVVVGMAGSVLGVAGAVLGGFLTRRLGRSQVLALSCGGQAVALAAFLPLGAGFAPVPLTVAVLSFFAATYAAASVAVNTILMDLTRRQFAASDFTILTSLASLVTLAGGALSIAIAEHTGYQPVLLVAVGLVLVATAVNLRQPDPVYRWGVPSVHATSEVLPTGRRTS